jgi:hypothetical protein
MVTPTKEWQKIGARPKENDDLQQITNPVLGTSLV